MKKYPIKLTRKEIGMILSNLEWALPEDHTAMLELRSKIKRALRSKPNPTSEGVK